MNNPPSTPSPRRRTSASLKLTLAPLLVKKRTDRIVGATLVVARAEDLISEVPVDVTGDESSLRPLRI